MFWWDTYSSPFQALAAFQVYEMLIRAFQRRYDERRRKTEDNQELKWEINLTRKAHA